MEGVTWNITLLVAIIKKKGLENLIVFKLTAARVRYRNEKSEAENLHPSFTIFIHSTYRF